MASNEVQFPLTVDAIITHVNGRALPDTVQFPLTVDAIITHVNGRALPEPVKVPAGCVIVNVRAAAQ